MAEANVYNPFEAAGEGQTPPAGQVESYLLLDPVTFVQMKPKYAIFKGGLDNNYQQYPSVSFSNNLIQFSVITPNPNIVLDRRLYIGIPIQFTVTGDTGDDNIPIFQYGTLDAFRAFPLQVITTTLTATINNLSLSIPQHDLFPIMGKYTSFPQDQIGEYSLFPSYMDASQEYSELVNSLVNPLGSYPGSSVPYTNKRGEYPIVILSNSRTSATFATYIVCPIILSPFLFKGEAEPGFYGVQNFTLNFTLGDLSLALSHTVINTSGPFTNAWTTINGTIQNVQVTSFFPWARNQPTLYARYSKPNATMDITEKYFSPWATIDRYVTFAGQLIPGATLTDFASQNIQLSQIPKRIYLFARERNQDRRVDRTDTCAVITNVNITFDNRTGILSSASMQDLYHISKKNGYCGTWYDWIGMSGIFNNVTGQFTSTFGSIMCIDFGDDIGLPVSQAPGMTGTYQLLVKASFKNPNPVRAINYDFYVVVVNEGLFYTQNLQAFSATGTVTPQDLMKTENMNVMENKRSNFYGMGWLDVLKKGAVWAGRIARAAAGPLSMINPAVGTAVGATGQAIGSVVGQGRHGGARMNLEQLRKRLREI